jgi:hypothetical protein
MWQLSTARIRGEKARTRYERALAGLNALKEDMDPTAAEAKEEPEPASRLSKRTWSAR